MAATTDTRQFDPTARMDYDYEDCAMWRRKTRPISWRKLGARYRRHHSTVNERYETDRHKSIRSDQRGVGTNGSQRHRSVPEDSKSNSTNPTNIELNRIRRSRYETIEPTKHREEIETLDQLVKWIQTYTPYMQGKWDNSNTRENARVLFFDVFKAGKSTLIGKPRGSGKSKVSVAVYLCILANYYLPQAIIVNGPKAKSRIYAGLIRVVKYNSLFRFKYGDIIASNSKLGGSLELHPELIDDLYERTGYVTDDPLIQISVYSGIIGAHPYVVWLEDILQSEFKAMESNEYLLYEVFDGIIKKLSTRIGGTLTRKGKDDLYSHMPSRNVMLLVRGAIMLIKGHWPTTRDLIYENDDKEGRAIDINIPEGSEFVIIERPEWTVKSLLIERTLALKDPRAFEMFEREMQNNPILSEGLYFRGCDIEEVDPFTSGELTNKSYMVFDPAFGESDASSDTAIFIIGLYQGYFWIMEVVIDKFNDTQLLEVCERLHRQYNPLLSWGENDFKQLSRNSMLFRGLSRLRGFDVFYSKGFGDKFSRINQLHPPLHKKQFKIYKTARDKTKLRLQIRTYNQRKGKLDGLDGLASGYRLLEDKLYIDEDKFFMQKI